MVELVSVRFVELRSKLFVRFSVELLSDRPPVVTFGTKFAVRLFKDKVPVPLTVPELWLNVPLLTFMVAPDTAIVPVFVKLGDVPDCVSVTSAFTLIVPLLLPIPDTLFTASG